MPSVVVRLASPETVIVVTPLVTLSMILRLVFVVVPQVPACSPTPINSKPPLPVYVLAI